MKIFCNYNWKCCICKYPYACEEIFQIIDRVAELNSNPFTSSVKFSYEIYYHISYILL